MICYVAQDDWRNAEFGHLGKDGSAEVVCSPPHQVELMTPNNIRDNVSANAPHSVITGFGKDR
jgi:hypothetical protein